MSSNNAPKPSRRTRREITRVKQFTAAIDGSDESAQVHLARPIARHLLLGEGGLQEDLIKASNRLAGPTPDKESAQHWDSYCRHLFAAFAIGIAVGHFTKPDLFEVYRPGGAR